MRNDGYRYSVFSFTNEAWGILRTKGDRFEVLYEKKNPYATFARWDNWAPGDGYALAKWDYNNAAAYVSYENGLVESDSEKAA